MLHPAISVFNEQAREYDAWFDQNRAVFQSELEALKSFLPTKGKGLEIGVGSGRFAVALGINFGIDPSPAMLAIAQSRNIEVFEGVALLEKK